MGRLALVLPGGGARGAYQSGALLAVGEICDSLRMRWPFPILTGVSCGALNASFLAAHLGSLKEATGELALLWEQVTTDQVLETGPWPLLKTSAKWLRLLFFGAMSRNSQILSLLDTKPLRQLIRKHIDFRGIQKRINEGSLKNLAITALDYQDGLSHTFYSNEIGVQPWVRVGRVSQHAQITEDHIMASTAIPLLFPPVRIHQRYFGDGSVRHYHPLSPAIHLGADCLLAIGVKHLGKGGERIAAYKPSPGRVAGVILNSVFLDAMDRDYERLERINDTLRFLPEGAPTSLRPIRVCVIRPSEDIGKIAAEEQYSMPRSLRYLVQGVGTTRENSDLISYLLFESQFTRRLLNLGYCDTMAQRGEVEEFLRCSTFQQEES